MARGGRFAKIDLNFATVQLVVLGDGLDDPEPGWITQGEEDIRQSDLAFGRV